MWVDTCVVAYALQLDNNQRLSISKPPIILIIRVMCVRFASLFRVPPRQEFTYTNRQNRCRFITFVFFFSLAVSLTKCTYANATCLFWYCQCNWNYHEMYAACQHGRGQWRKKWSWAIQISVFAVDATDAAISYNANTDRTQFTSSQINHKRFARL